MRSTLLNSVPSQVNPVHTLPTYVIKNSFNIILHLRLSFPSGLFPSGLPNKTFYAFPFFPKHGTLQPNIPVQIPDKPSLSVCEHGHILNLSFTKLKVYTFIRGGVSSIEIATIPQLLMLHLFQSTCDVIRSAKPDPSDVMPGRK